MKSKQTTTKPTLLDQMFWQSFAKKHWEKKAVVARNVKSGLLEMTDLEIFNLLVLYADRCRKLGDPEGFKFFIEGVRVDAELALQVLPEKKDKSLLSYHSRMQTRFADYCLVCDELLQVNLKKQHLLTEFTDDLYKYVGFPNRFAEMGLYLGNYRKTPFGVHEDACGVFSFPVAGVKKFRLWSPEFVKKNPALERAFNYSKYKKASRLLEAIPGDMTYWPSSAWHIAESDGSFSATWSLGVWVDRPHQETLSDSLKVLLKEKGGSVDTVTRFKNLHSATGEVTELPEVYRKSFELLKNLKPEELEEAFLKDWMKHISAKGFKTTSVAGVKFSVHSKIQLRDKRSLILWKKSQIKKGEFYFSFGGTTVESKSAGFLKLVTALNKGEECTIRDFLKGATQKNDLRSLQSLAKAVVPKRAPT